MKNKISILEIKKFLQKKGFVIRKQRKIKKEGTNLGSLPRTFLTSLIIISIFFFTPLVIDFTKQRASFSKDYENNSKKI